MRKIARPIDQEAMQIKWLTTQARVRPAGRQLALLREAAGRICVGIWRRSAMNRCCGKHTFLFDKITHIGYKFKLPRRRRVPMADGDSDYRVGSGRPPLHTRFKGG